MLCHDGPMGTASSLRLEPCEHGGATGEDIVQGYLEIVRVPGVGDIAGMVGPVEQERYLVFRVGSSGLRLAHGVPAPAVAPLAQEQPVDASKVLRVHPHDVVKLSVVGRSHLARPMVAAGDARPLQCTTRAGMDVVSQLLAAGGRRVDHKLVGAPRLAREVGKDELGHGGPADVAVAYEEDLGHVVSYARAMHPNRIVSRSRIKLRL